MKHPKLLYVAGPTASGKTSLAIALAQHFNTEIISCDSRQFYKEMRIGTAVPSREEQEQVPHHFVQHLSIHNTYTVGNYVRDVLALLPKLFSQNEVVILLQVVQAYTPMLYFMVLMNFPRLILLYDHSSRLFINKKALKFCKIYCENTIFDIIRL